MHKAGIKPVPINTIFIHPEPHVDEYVAVWLLQSLGGRHFSGIADAEVKFERPDELVLAGRTPEQMEAAGILMIGVGGGRFDEHAEGDADRDPGQSAASKVAEFLGCARNPVYKELIEYATADDNDGRRDPFGFSAGLMNMHAAFPAELAWKWGMFYIDAHVQQKKAFFVEARNELQRAEVTEHRLDKTEIRIVSARSDARRLKARAFSRFEDRRNAVVVQRQSTGHTQVFVNPHYHLDLSRVVAEIRKAELIARGGSPDSSVNYAAANTMEIVPAWHYFREGNILFNGSLTDPNRSPSRLSLEEVTDLVIKNIRKKRPAKARRELALSGASQA